MIKEGAEGWEPKGPWIVRQQWKNLLFAHWDLDPRAIEKVLPAGMEPDLWEGRGWIGLVPFLMDDVMLRGMPGLPWISQFPEVNVRTYVRWRGRPAVFFISLDASLGLAVWIGKNVFSLPYFHAEMQMRLERNTFVFTSQRRNSAGGFSCHYRPKGILRTSEAGSIEHWLTERYAFLTEKVGTIYAGIVDHERWPLQECEGEVISHSIASVGGLTLPEEPPLMHFSPGVQTRAWSLKKIT